MWNKYRSIRQWIQSQPMILVAFEQSSLSHFSSSVVFTNRFHVHLNKEVSLLSPLGGRAERTQWHLQFLVIHKTAGLPNVWWNTELGRGRPVRSTERLTSILWAIRDSGNGKSHKESRAPQTVMVKRQISRLSSSPTESGSLETVSGKLNS